MNRLTVHLIQQIVEWVLITAGSLQFLGAVVWTTWIIRKYRRELKRSREGLCMYCGYDLRQSKDRCPECGQKILRLRRES
jgi:uncharacterized paraquat-inducible protein A